MAKRVLVSLTVVDGADLDRVAEALRARGLTVDKIMSGLGIIEGEADEQALEQLRSTPEVEALEPSRAFKLPPPDSPVQ